MRSLANLDSDRRRIPAGPRSVPVRFGVRAEGTSDFWNPRAIEKWIGSVTRSRCPRALETLTRETARVDSIYDIHSLIAEVLRPPDYLIDTRLTFSQSRYCKDQLCRLLDLCKAPGFNSILRREIFRLVAYCNNKIDFYASTRRLLPASKSSSPMGFMSSSWDIAHMRKGISEESFSPEIFHKFQSPLEELQTYASAIIRTYQRIDISELPENMQENIRRLHVDFRR